MSDSPMIQEVDKVPAYIIALHLLCGRGAVDYERADRTIHTIVKVNVEDMDLNNSEYAESIKDSLKQVESVWLIYPKPEDKLGKVVVL